MRTLLALDVPAYARLRRMNRVIPCFIPSPGSAFLRVTLTDLPAVALAAVLARAAPPSVLAAAVRRGASPGAWLRTQFPAGAGEPPRTDEQARLLLASVGTSPTGHSANGPYTSARRRRS